VAQRPEEFGHGRIEGVAGRSANNAAPGSYGALLSLGIPPPRIAVINGRSADPGVRRPLSSRKNQSCSGLLMQHYHREHHPGGSQPSADRFVCQLAAGSLPHPLPGHSLHLSDGTYSISYSTSTWSFLLAFGFLGCFFRKLEYDLAPFVLALIIGP